jgi:hypothetical protein
MEDAPCESLDELLTTIQLKLTMATSGLRMLTVAAPFCDPLLAEIEIEVQEAARAATAARRSADNLVQRITGSTSHGHDFSWARS